MQISMHSGLAVGVVVALVGSMSAALSAGRDEDDARGVMAAVDELDHCIQQRFAKTGQVFGFGRMVSLSNTVHGSHLFVAESESEAAMVHRFDAAGAQVVMYLAGHDLPRRGPQGGRVSPRPPVQGPVFVHPMPSRLVIAADGSAVKSEPLSVFNTLKDGRDERMFRNVPGAAQLKARAVESLGAMWQQDSHAFEVGDWKFIARPIRATAQSCLNCHNWRPQAEGANPTSNEEALEQFRLGDPLGAVLYAVRPLPTN
jgi:hypothetical protein